MIELFIVLTLLCGFIFAVDGRFSSNIRYLALVFCAIAMIMIYVFSGDELAQDRFSYFQWYQEFDASDSIFSISLTSEPLFNLALYLFPDGMDYLAFKIVFSLLLFILLSFTVRELLKRTHIDSRKIGLLLVCLVSDRIFLDLLLNTSRSTIACLLFLLGIVCASRIRGAIWLASSFLVHSGVGVLCILSYGLYTFLKSNIRILNTLVIVSIFMLLYRYFSQAPIFALVEEVYFPFLEGNIERINRARTTTVILTLPLLIQVSIALVVPCLISIRNKKWLSGEGLGKVVRIRVVALSTAVSVIALILFPDFSMAQRLFVIPIILYLLSMGNLTLAIFAAIKLAILAGVIGSYIDPL